MSSHTPEIALRANNINKRFGEFHVLKNLSLDVCVGAIHGLVGLNGSGKTTSLDCFLGLQKVDAGNVDLLGFKPEALHLAKGKVVSIFDTPSLNPNLTVRQTLDHAALLCTNLVRDPDEVETLLKIEKYSHFKIKNLSLGNKRRASIAHALLGSPELVLLDEPFNGLDAGGVDDVLDLIKTLNAQEGTTFLLSSHQLPYLEQVCSHLSILHQGEIVLTDTIDSLLKDSKSVALVRSSNISGAIDVINASDKASVLKQDDDGLIHVELNDFTSSQLNSLLVKQDIPVEELHLKKATLGGIFRDYTGE